MNKKQLLKKKKEFVEKMKTNILDEESIKALKVLGFLVKYDDDSNMYLFDVKNNERMYTNTKIIQGTLYKISEDEHFSLEFSIVNKQVKNITLYEKGKSLKLVYKK